MNGKISELVEQIYKDFYEDPFIKSIEGNEKWTISDGKKRPININALMETNQVYGADITSEENPCTSLTKLKKYYPAMTNCAYYLNAIQDGFVVLDIEPCCPDDILYDLLKTDYIYAELSLSKKGVHLIYKLPEGLKKYSYTQKMPAIKEEHGYYEILLNHWVTFTRWNIMKPKTPDTQKFQNILNELAQKTEVRKSKERCRVIEFEKDKMPEIWDFDEIIRLTTQYEYRKTPNDFPNDMSRYEYGYVGWLYYQLSNVLSLNKYKNRIYTDEQKLYLLYYSAKQEIPYRAKHDGMRNGMPWLMYLSHQIMTKT